MADKTIGELPAIISLDDDALLVVEQQGQAVKLSGAQLKDYAALDIVSVAAETLPAGSEATAEYDKTTKTLSLGIPAGDDGSPGAAGNGIASVTLKSGTHAAGTTDVYTITYTDGTTFDFSVYNGADGEGAGDMLKSVYDPSNKARDIFEYAEAVSHKVTVISATSTDVQYPSAKAVYDAIQTEITGAWEDSY